MRKLRRKIRRPLFAISLMFASSAMGFTLNSGTDPNFSGWADPEIRFVVNPANCPADVDIPALIEESAKVWTEVASTRVRVSYVGPTTSTSHSDPVTVYCETNFQGVTGADQNSVPGGAAIVPSNSRPVAGLLILNASAGQANISLFDQTKLRVILAHEIGHILGLGHSEDKNALMYYDASAKSNLRLSQDDIDGITYLYARNELGKDQPLGCGRVQTLPPSTSGGMGGLLVLLFPFLMFLWLRNRWPLQASGKTL